MSDFNVVVAQDLQILKRSMAVRKQVFQIEKGIPEELEVDNFDALGAECDHFVASVNGEDVCGFRARPMENGCVQLQRYSVKKERRRKGFGKKALEFAENFYRDAGYKKIVLDAKYHVKDFYLRCGYTQTTDVFEEMNIPHIGMEKVL